MANLSYYIKKIMDIYKIHFVPLGGVVGVTKNMYVYELYKNNELQDIITVDCGIGFPNGDELGVDFVIPDTSYLYDKKDKIRAMLFTHGHEDHITALPYNYSRLDKPPVYGSKLTCLFIKNRAKEFKLDINTNEVDYKKTYVFGDFKVQFVTVTHSIPDTTHIIIKTPLGIIYHGSDFKFDVNPAYGKPPDFYEICKAGKEGVLCLLSDCLGSERDGLTMSESEISKTFEDEMRKTKGRFIMTTFSSNISRIRQCIDAAIKFNRKIVFLGRSMKDNAKIAQENGYLPSISEHILKENNITNIPPKKLCIVCAGSQGQYDSALSKIMRKQNPFIKIEAGDKVLFSSDPIPGNDEEVDYLIEELTLQGADVIYTNIHDSLHTSGHGSRDDMRFLLRFTNPKYMIPIGGTIKHQRQYQILATDMGFKKDSILMLCEGETIWFTKNSAERGETVKTKNIYVDSCGVSGGDMSNIVLRDRSTLS